jgi:single-stranded DNA-binding protein
VVSEFDALDPGATNDDGRYTVRLSGADMVAAAEWVRIDDYVYVEGRVRQRYTDSGDMVYQVNAERIGRGARPWMPSEGDLHGVLQSVTPDWIMLRCGRENVTVRIGNLCLWEVLDAWENLAPGENVVIALGDDSYPEWHEDHVRIVIDRSLYVPTPRLMNSFEVVARMKYDAKFHIDNNGYEVARFIAEWFGSNGIRTATVLAWGDEAERIKRTMRGGDPVYVEGRLYKTTWIDKIGGHRRHRMGIYARRVTAAIETDTDVRNLVNCTLKWRDVSRSITTLSDIIWV